MRESRTTNPYSAGTAVRRSASGKSVIRGYAAVFYRSGDASTEYELYPGLVERIRPGAFDRAIAEKQDVRGLINHSSDILLGRTTAGTMTLAADSVGLRYEILFNPDDADHARYAEKIKRGDLSGASFSFVPTAQSIESGKGGSDVRWVEDVNLFDVGPVTFPAYKAATSGIRSAGYGGGVRLSTAEAEARKRRVAQIELELHEAWRR